jgi:16S rRNA (uracil1498-N3)-methyltransferase
MRTDDRESRRPDILFWYGRSASTGERVTLDAEESRHLVGVVRKREGDTVWLADGQSAWLAGRLAKADPKRVEIEITAVVPATTAAPCSVDLAFPGLRPARTELLLEKCTELGIATFHPIRFQRARPGSAREARWERVVRSAALQSLRARPPRIEPPLGLEEWTAGLGEGGLRWVASPDGDPPDPGPPTSKGFLIVGPEGDFTAEERAALDAAGFRRVGLGPTRLRTETAAIALVSVLVATSARWGLAPRPERQGDGSPA